MESKTIDWKIRDQALKISETSTTRQGEGGVSQRTLPPCLPPPQILLTPWKLQRSRKQKRGKRDLFCFSQCLLLGNLADSQGKETRSLQCSRQHLISSDWSYLLTPGQSAASVWLRAISTRDQMSKQCHKAAIQSCNRCMQKLIRTICASCEHEQRLFFSQTLLSTKGHLIHGNFTCAYQNKWNHYPASLRFFYKS